MPLLRRVRPAVPEPRSEPSFARVLELPPAPERWLLTLVHAELTLSSWGIPTHLARHWLHEAQPLLEGSDPQVLTLELDPANSLISIELLTPSGHRLFGIDGYVS